MSRQFQIQRMWKREAGRFIWQARRIFRKVPSCRLFQILVFFPFQFSNWKSDPRLSNSAQLPTGPRSNLAVFLRLRGYLKKIKMADLLIGACLSSGQMCGESKQRRINFASHFKAAASDL